MREFLVACHRHMPLLARQSMDAGMKFGAMMAGGAGMDPKAMGDMEKHMGDYLPQAQPPTPTPPQPVSPLSAPSRAPACPRLRHSVGLAAGAPAFGGGAAVAPPSRGRASVDARLRWGGTEYMRLRWGGEGARRWG